MAKTPTPGDRLRVARAERRLSQMEVAAYLGCGHNRYWRIENNYQAPTETEKVKLARLLKTDAFQQEAA